VLREVIPCERCGYNAIDLDIGQAVVVASSHEVVFEGGPEAPAQHASRPADHPRVRRRPTVQRLSDDITRRQLHRTQLYRDVHRRSSLAYQLGVQLPKVGRNLDRPASSSV
jgi:hypothetical protein